MKKFKLEDDDELNELTEQASKVKSSIKPDSPSIKKTNVKNNILINFTIFSDDSWLAVPTKKLINEAKITLQTLYDLFGQNAGYRMFYSIKANNQLGAERVRLWCDVLGVVPVLTFRPMSAEEKKAAKKRIKEAAQVKRKNKK